MSTLKLVAAPIIGDVKLRSRARGSNRLAASSIQYYKASAQAGKHNIWALCQHDSILSINRVWFAVKYGD